jgi:hypothetical protein
MAGFNFLLGDRLSLLTFIALFFIPSRQVLEECLKLDYDFLLRHPVKFIVNWPSYESTLYFLSYWQCQSMKDCADWSWSVSRLLRLGSRFFFINRQMLMWTINSLLVLITDTPRVRLWLLRASEFYRFLTAYIHDFYSDTELLRKKRRRLFKRLKLKN